MNTAVRTVAVGMSGGVDSSVAALLVQRTGCRVVGVTMRIYGGDLPLGCAPGACYGPDEEQDAASARRVCSALGIPFVEVDLRAEYRARVLDYFSREYRAGRTPNPCVRCNQELKFGLLVERLATEAGIRADGFATGHYAGVALDPGSGRYTLRAGIDPVKDQSYFLCMLTQGQLARAVFPLGGMRKSEVRALAREGGLAVHDRTESQDFAAGDYRAMVGPGSPSSEGFFRTAAGKVVGRHKGVWAYTVGQRRGLGIGAGEPLYVTGIDPGNEHGLCRTRRGAGSHEPGDGSGELGQHRAPDAAGSRRGQGPLAAAAGAGPGDPARRRQRRGALRPTAARHRPRPVGRVLRRGPAPGRGGHRGLDLTPPRGARVDQVRNLLPG